MNLTRALRTTGRRLSVPVVFILSMLMIQPAFSASNVQGGINGQVVTSDGNAVNAASVTVTNLGTGFSRTEATGANGSFSFNSLPVGNYSVTVDASGYPQASRETNVNIGVSTSVTMIVGGEATELGAVTVTGQAISPIDLQSTEAATILGEQTIDRLPVGRNLTDVALLAPGTTRGDTAFTAGIASFGGSTVGENVCYINGLNVTNFRNGLGCSTVPFEFYQEFNIKTGGYGAEFGRSTGGVISAATKSGTNEFHYGANLYYQPWIDGLSGASPNSYTPSTGGIFDDNLDDENSDWNLSLWASGPIVEDRAFFYVLYNPRSEEFDNYDGAGGAAYFGSDDDAFWGTKLDFYITQDHLLELTAFNDSSTVEQDYHDYTWNDLYDQEVGDYIGTYVDETGGQNWMVKYTGYLTPDFTLSAAYGKNEYSLTSTITTFDVPLVTDRSSGTSVVVQNAIGGGPYGTDEDEREQYRVDAEWLVGDSHALRFGIDYEENTANTDLQYSGGAFYRIEDADSVFRQIYTVGGGFTTITDALYIEDKWQVSDTLLLSLGLRNERFENQNQAGEAFIEIDNQISPRLGFAWDAMDDGTLKVFGNYGRYYLPIATNTNVRLTGNEFFVRQTFAWDGTFDADGVPTLGAPETAEQVLADGTIKETIAVVDEDIEPMYQDELILGFMKDVGNGWSVGTRFIHRDLKSTIEDLTIDAALEAQFPGFGIGAFHYVLDNPGSDMSIVWDFDADGDEDVLNFTADELGFPESERYYNAVEFLFERAWDGVWFLQGSYTWSQSYGNNEGFVRSDNGQDDAGLTTLYDFPGLLDGAYGYLPNDRRHALKVFGAWQFSDHWQVGANFLMQSGRPISAFGNHPTDVFAALYGHEAFYQNGVLVPRGTRGNTPYTSSLDLSLKYMTMIGNADVTFGLDLFNVFNADNATEVREIAEFDVPVFTLGPGDPDPNYGVATSFQRPRAVRLSASFEF